MGLKRIIRKRLRASGYEKVDPKAYNQDGLRSVHDHSFMNDPRFQAAYARGVQAATDYAWHWRVHVGLWAAESAAQLQGDFVECGVNRGFLSSAIMQYLDWDKLGRSFYLLDTFAGMDERYMGDSDAEKEKALEKNKKRLETGFYVSTVDSVVANFSQWKNVRIVQGAVPDTLARVDSTRIAYLHLDMNCAPPEIAAAEFFWPRLAPGAFVLLDDYAYGNNREQKEAMDHFAGSRGVPVLSLPTGQGLFIKPAAT